MDSFTTFSMAASLGMLINRATSLPEPSTMAVIDKAGSTVSKALDSEEEQLFADYEKRSSGGGYCVIA